LTPNSEQTAMFLETTSLTTLTPGEVSTISGLEVIGKAAGTSTLQAHVHATVKVDTLCLQTRLEEMAPNHSR
jgi:hypothetical protein